MSRFSRALRRRPAVELLEEITEDLQAQARDEELEKRAAFKGKRNAYYCDVCRGYVVTIDRDAGVTPMFLACRVKGDPRDPANDCKGRSRSMMYPPEPWPEEDGYGTPIPTEPTWEWYMPDEDECKRLKGEDLGAWEHVEKGGLLLRPIAVDGEPATT